MVLARLWVLHSTAPSTCSYPRMMLTKNLYRRGVKPAGATRPEGTIRGLGMIEEVAARLGGDWRVSRKLAGGWNQGAYLVCGHGGKMAVLMSYAKDPDRADVLDSRNSSYAR